MSIDGIEYATDTRLPYRFVVDTFKFPDGEYELGFVATDHAGNASGRVTVSVNFRTSDSNTGGSATDISLTSPADGETVAQDTAIRATVADTDGLATVEWFVDGLGVHSSAVSGQSTGLSYMWRVADYATGRHTITLIVTDLLGHRTTGELDLIKR